MTPQTHPAWGLPHSGPRVWVSAVAQPCGHDAAACLRPPTRLSVPSGPGSATCPLLCHNSLRALGTGLSREEHLCHPGDQGAAGRPRQRPLLSPVACWRGAGWADSFPVSPTLVPGLASQREEVGVGAPGSGEVPDWGAHIPSQRAWFYSQLLGCHSSSPLMHTRGFRWHLQVVVQALGFHHPGGRETQMHFLPLAGPALILGAQHSCLPRAPPHLT